MSNHGGEEPGGLSWREGGHEEASEHIRAAGSEQPLSDPPTVELGLPREQPVEDPDPHSESEPFGATEQIADAGILPGSQQPALAQQPESDSGAGFAEDLKRPLPPEQLQDEAAKALPTDFKPLRPRESAWGESASAGPLPENGTLQSNGAGPPANVSAPGALARGSLLQRPETTLAAAFLAGVLLAGLIKRRRSR